MENLLLKLNVTGLSLFESVFLSLVEQVCLTASKVYNLRAAVSILFLYRALFAVVSVGHTSSTADHAPSLETSVIALITNPDQCTWTHVRVADHTLAVAFFTQAPDGYKTIWKYNILWKFVLAGELTDSWLFAAEDEIWMMLCHCLEASVNFNSFCKIVFKFQSRKVILKRLQWLCSVERAWKFGVQRRTQFKFVHFLDVCGRVQSSGIST